MRALPLTKTSKPGGRPRKQRAPRNAFADWLLTSKLSVEEIAESLKCKSATVYNLRNSQFLPSREMALKIEQLTGGKVSIESWSSVKAKRAGKSAQ